MIAPPANKPHPESLWIGALLTVLVALGQVSMSIYIPSLPALVAELRATAETVNLTLALFLFGFALFQLVYGPLSDRYGRRPVLLGGLVLYTAASVACALSPSVDALIVARFAQGVGACAGQAIGRAVVRDVYGRDRAAKAMAYIGAALAVSPAVTPALGGVLEVWLGWQSVFWFVAGLGVLVIVATWLFLSETSPERDGAAGRLVSTLASFRTLLRDRAYLGYAIAVSGVFGALMAFTAAAPFVFISGLGLAPHEFGALSVFNVAGFFAGSVFAGRYALRLGPQRMVLLGIVMTIAGGALMVGFAATGHASIPTIIGPMLVSLTGLGPVLSSGMAGAMASFPRIAGAASGLLGFLQMSVAAGVSSFAGHLDNSGPLPMALTILALGVATLFLFVAAMRPLGNARRDR